MQTIYDWVTVAIFGALIVLFLHRSTAQEEPKDNIYQYLPACIGCALANYVGNEGYGAAAFVAHEGPPPMDARAAALLAPPEARARLADLAEFLGDAPWERADLDSWLRDYAEVKGVKLGQVAQPLRAALTGSSQSPPIDAVLFALGRTEAMDRILAAAAEGDESAGEV